MKKLRDVLLILVILLFLAGVGYFIFRPEAKTHQDVPVQIEVVTPDIKGSSDTIRDPEPIREKIVYKDRVVFKENPYNKELERKYLEATTEIERLNLYLEAIKENKYDVSFVDSIQDVTVHSTVQGKLLEQSIDYHIKPRKHIIDTVLPIKLPKRSELYGSIELGVPTQNHTPASIVVKANAVIVNKKDQIFSMAIDSKLRAWFGFGIKF
jgi:DNA-dependent RNA polymerase auxiliary subunit epsilon